jgi:sulfoxide reductase heme-binding subunit YedZ
LAVSGPTLLWYAARGSGLVSLLLLTASVVLGIVTTARWSNERWPRFTISFVHRNVSFLAVVFLVVHIATMVLDGFAPIGWLDTVIPFTSPYRALWLGVGVLASDLLVAVVVTSLLRNRIGARTWSLVHWLSYPLWALAVVHGLGTGTDTRTAVVLIANAACVIAVLMAVWWRCAIARSAPPALRGSALVATAVLPVALVVWLLAGPLASGWARRAGTPAALLGGAAQSDAASAAPAHTPAPTTSPGSGFSAAFTGTVALSGRGSNSTVVVNGRLDHGERGTLTVSLDAQDDGSGTLNVRNGTVQILDPSGRMLFDGYVTNVRDGVLTAAARAGGSWRLYIRFGTFDTRAGTASGIVERRDL